MIIYHGKNTLIPPKNPEILGVKNITYSNYLQLKQVELKHNHDIHTWDIVNALDSVAVILFHTELNGFIFVRQFRIPVFVKHNNNGFMYEICAGLVDKELKLEDIAREEVIEETGYHVLKLEYISSFYSSANGSKQDIFFANINESMKQSEGGGNKSEKENIDIIFVPLHLIHEFLEDDSCPKNNSICFSVYWYLCKLKEKNGEM